MENQQTLIEPRAEEEIRAPRPYRVLLHNDPYTTMEFVIEVIVAVFHKPAAEATRIMLDVHHKGIGVVGAYPYDIAASRAREVERRARQSNFPLKCTVEEA